MARGIPSRQIKSTVCGSLLSIRVHMFHGGGANGQDACRAASRLQARRSTMAIAACSYEAPRHRAGMLASLEDRNARRKRCFISIDPLHETPAAGRLVVHELRLVQPHT